jgi:long-chain fatty acid transport protein
MTNRFVRTPISTAAIGLTIALGAAPVFGAGFQLNESSASGLGNAFAGGAAAAEDATTLWSNVAGMARIRTRQAVGALHLVTPSIKFSNEASSQFPGTALGGNGGDAGGVNAVPNLYLVYPIDAQWSVGLGVTVPWGLVTEYDSGWIGRFQALKSSIETININPAVSWKAAPNLALGFGLNFQGIEADFTNQVNYSAALLGAAARNGIAPGSPTFNAIAQSTAGLESRTIVEGSDTAIGWNVGVLFDLDAKSRVGAQYRSSIKYKINGDVKFENPTPVVPPALAPLVGALAAGINSTVLYDSGISSEVEIPAIVNLSYFTSLNDRWDLMFDAQWTQWSTIEDLTFVRDNGSVLQSTPENFKDSWKLAVGANYRYSSAWLLRGGLAFDQSPVQDAYRTARLPDNDRTWLTAGAQYSMAPNMKVDFGAAYVWVKKATINADGSSSGAGVLNGHYNANTVIVSGQLNYAF